MRTSFQILLVCLLLIGCDSAEITLSSKDSPGSGTEDFDILFTVDPLKDQKPISPYIYGTNSEAEVKPGISLYRMGGNRWSTFNWENNASNSGFDNDHTHGNWLCVLQGCLSQNFDKPGEVLRLGFRRALDSGAAPLITIPIGDFVAANKVDRVTQTALVNASSWKVNRSSKTSGAPNIQPDTADDYVYQEESVLHIKKTFEADIASARPVFFSLDNEPGLWASTHEYAHPDKVTYTELVSRTIEFGTMIKRVLPTAQVFGGVAYGYNELNSLQNAADRILGDSQGITFFEYFLNRLKNEELVSGQRVVDVLDMHWGSEARGDNYRISNSEEETPNTDAVVAARLQAPRSLWDVTYTENSWITEDMTSGPIALIPRLKAMINRAYPGTKISFSEYAHGGEKHISGGLAQVDTLGIFGREGVFAAAHWDRESEAPFVYGAIKLFTNYTGNGDSVGDTSVRATTSNYEKTSVFAMTDSLKENLLYVIALNKTGSEIKGRLAVNSADGYQHLQSFEIRDGPLPQLVSSTNLGSGSIFNTVLPPMSATLFVFEK